MLGFRAIDDLGRPSAGSAFYTRNRAEQALGHPKASIFDIYIYNINIYFLI